MLNLIGICLGMGFIGLILLAGMILFGIVCAGLTISILKTMAERFTGRG